jgi:UDP-N-acetylmuramate dehydrogenase
MNNLNQVTAELKKECIDFKLDVSLEKLSWIGVSGRVNLLVCPRTDSALVKACKILLGLHVEYRVLGFTSNLFFTYEGEAYDCFISTKYMKEWCIDGDILTADCGASLTRIARETAKLGFSAFESMVGIPASIGGAVVMNAGSFGTDISDILIDARIYKEGTISIINNEQLDFSRRNSVLRRPEYGGVLLSARFKLNKEDPASLERRLLQVGMLRSRYQEDRIKNIGTLYSVDDFYGCIAADHFFFKCVFHLPFLYLTKFVNRLCPKKLKKIWLVRNRIIDWYFKYPLDRKVYSDVSLNCIVNHGNLQPTDFKVYTDWLEQISGGRLNRKNLENELI